MEMISGQNIHPTAIIESGAELPENIFVGPYAYIGSNVKLGNGCHIHHHATVDGLTILGQNCEVFPYALIGGKTHDLKYTGGMPGLKVGDRNVFREYVSVHGATKEGEWTTLGNDNVLLAYSHVAHDCIVGDHLVMSSHAALGGHVEVGDCVNIGWNAGVHQFCCIGSYAMIGACAKLVQDVLPYMIADGSPAIMRTVNRVGLQRRRFSPEDIEAIRRLFKKIHQKNLNRQGLIAYVEENFTAEIGQSLLKVLSRGTRGLA